jgi:hypothetical protein
VVVIEQVLVSSSFQLVFWQFDHVKLNTPVNQHKTPGKPISHGKAHDQPLPSAERQSSKASTRTFLMFHQLSQVSVGTQGWQACDFNVHMLKLNT